jgi:SAM-dependent methyltransferase
MWIEKLYGMYSKCSAEHWSALSVAGNEQIFIESLSTKSVKTVLEIGTHYGVTAAFFAELGYNVITIDIERSDMAVDLWKRLNLSDKITYHIVDNNNEKVKVIDKSNFDFVFIDGDHRSGQVKIDFDAVRKCGNVLFHDYVHGYAGFEGTAEVVDSLPIKQIKVMGDFALWQI